MVEPTRIGAQEAYNRIKGGSALFVCGYEEESRYRDLRLEMSMSFSDFVKKLPALSKDQEIIFYCA